MNQASEETPKTMQPFEPHGVEWESCSKDQWRGTCPFCGKSKFHANPEDGQRDCKVCGKKGNVTTFLGHVHTELYRPNLTSEVRQEWAEQRGIPASAFNDKHFGVDSDGQLTFTVYAETGYVRDIRTYRNGKWMSTKGCSVYLGNADRIPKPADRHGRCVWIVEGEWDYAAMRWWLRKVGREHDVVLMGPGAGTFKDPWAKLLTGLDQVIVAYDNDAGGRRGSQRIVQKLQAVGVPCSTVQWKAKIPERYDVNDWVRYALQNGYTPKEAFAAFERMIVEAERPTNKFTPLSTAELANRPRLEMAVEALKLRRNCLAVLYAEPGLYKSFLAQKIAFAMGSGQPLLGGPCMQMPVVYIVAEGSGGMPKRNAALLQHTGWDGENVHWIDVPPNLLEYSEDGTGDLDQLIAELRRIGPGLVIFDTLARCLFGGDENSAQDMGKAVAALDRIRAEIGCSVLVVHHSNKSNGAVERGSSALRGAADLMLLMQRIKGDTGIKLSCDKAKDDEPFEAMVLDPVQVELPDGETSIVLEKREGALSPKNAKALQGLQNHHKILAELRKKPSGLTYKEIEQRTGFAASTVREHLGAMHEKGDVTKESTRTKGGGNAVLWISA